MKNNKKANPALFILMIMVGVFFVILGAGNLFARNNIIVGMLELAGGLFQVGVGLYRLMLSSGKKY